MSMNNPQAESNSSGLAGAQAASDTISYATAGTSFGRVLVARRARGVCAILLGDDDEELKADLMRRFPGVRIREDRGAVQDELGKISRFADGGEDGLDLELDLKERSSSERCGRSC